MTRAMAIAATLAGCFGGRPAPEDIVYNVECTVFATCGATGTGEVIPVVGTPEEVRVIAQGWVDSCSVVTDVWITSGDCPYVWCGAFCYGEDDGQ